MLVRHRPDGPLQTPPRGGVVSRHAARLEVLLLRYTYASLWVAAGIRAVGDQPVHGPREVTTTLTVYAHLINTDDHTGNMPP